MEKEAEATTENMDPEQIKEKHQQFLAELRSKFELTVTKGESPMTLTDYVTSLDLDPENFDIKKKKKIELDDYVHFFNFERKTDVVEASTLKWSIRRRASDFFKFQKKINAELTGTAKMSKTDIPQLSSLFNKKEESSPEKFSEAAETYLKKLLESPEIREKSTVLYDFIELCLLPLPVTQTKFKEGYLNKKGGGRFKHNKLKLFVSFMFAKCQERWFILTEDGILYTLGSSCIKTREILFFDQSFSVEYGKKATGHSNGVSLVTPNRRLNLLANDVFEAADWVGDIQKAAKQSPYTKVHRFSSFAPEREPVHNCKWYVDAVGYFEDLYEALSHAKREVFITDWWFTPEIALKRPVEDGESEYRLDKVLGKIANAGVKVYVIVYHEVRMLMYNDSEHVKITLESLSPNITVLKHPSEPFFSWSHHEKLVVVDQTIGFIGGLDLCFGRWDTSGHPLHDPAFEEGTGTTYFGQDYANPRLIDFRKVREQPDVSLIDKKATPRMPFHDAMVRVVGPAVADMSRHFIQFWNHVEVDCYDKEEDIPLPKHGLIPAVDENSFSKEKMMSQLRNTLKDVFGSRPNFFKNKKETVKNRLAAGKPISEINEIPEKTEKKKKVKEETKEADSEENKTEQNKELQLEATKQESDKSLLETRQESDSWLVSMQKALASLVTTCKMRKRKNHDAIEENAIALEKSMYMDESSLDLDLSQATEKSHTVGQSIKSKIDDRRQKRAQRKRGHKLSKEEMERINKREILQLLFMPEKDQLKGTVSCQMLRSAAQWSIGLNANEDVVESSILNSYIQVIQNAKHFIYIESQFFMSGTAGEALKNEISDVILYRIECAHARQERFRVLIFIPLIHAFEGDVADSKSALLRIQLHWQYMTISRGGQSIYEELKKKDINPEEYIQFYSIRQHHKMANGVPVTEMIYIHSKILIADDDILVIGSANVNDRSMKGSRDSEIAMHFDDSKKVTSHMNGVEVKVSEFVHTFRKRILAEHLGLSEDEVADPLTDSFIKTMNSRAQRNTEIYREVFAVDPDDNMRTLESMREFSKNKNLEKYDELAPQIKGHVVMYPLDFLCDENLLPSAGAMEYYLADHNFV